jgi:phospholipid/cholesterol/gamma-HCH transport system substrate-binding protein
VSRSLTRLQAALLGLVVLTGLGLGAAGLFLVGDREQLFNGSFTLRVGFPRLQGIGVGTPVRIRGIEAGTVAAVDLPDRPDGPILLRLRLDRRYQPLLFADAAATILSEGMVGARVVEIDPGVRTHEPVADGALIGSRPAPELADLLNQTQTVLADLKSGKGTLGKLLTDDRAYVEAVSTLKQSQSLMQKSQEAVQRGQEAATALKQDAEALRRLPLIRAYAPADAAALLVRPSHERHRQVLTAGDLFEPSRAVLTDAGRGKLDEVGPWLAGLRHKGSDVVVAAYADPAREPSLEAALVLTQKQAEAVAEYLRDKHGAHKLGWVSRRTVTPLGLGSAPSPAAEPETLPPARVEVNVFIPQS